MFCGHADKFLNYKWCGHCRRCYLGKVYACGLWRRFNAAGIHFRSTANQARFVHLRREMKTSGTSGEKSVSVLKDILHGEIALARQLHQIQSRDSRVGFEATNHWYYVPLELLEQIVNCQHLLNHMA